MTDTTTEAEDLYRRLLMQRSPEERLRMGCEMFDTARTLMRASLADSRDADGIPELNIATQVVRRRSVSGLQSSR